MKKLIGLLTILLLWPVSAWAYTTPNLPTVFEPGDTVPTPATSKFICASVNVTGATNASPIVLNTGGHFFTDGETVTVASVGGNTAANGTWVVTKVDSTHISLNGSTGNGSYTSGGTIACDYATITAFLAALSTNVWTGYLNQAETYIAPVSGLGTTTDNGFKLPGRVGASQYVVIRTWDDSSGHLPAAGKRVEAIHQPYLAKIQNGTTNQANITSSITCNKYASYYWLKAIEFTLPAGQMHTTQQTAPMITCLFAELNGDFASGVPTDKPITNVTYSGSTVTVSIDIPTHQDMRLNTNADITITGVGGITGINGNTYTMTRVNVGICGSFFSASTCQLTFTQAGVGGAYTSGGTVSLSSGSQWADHIVFDQIFMGIDNYQAATEAAPHWKAIGFTLAGTNLAVINSNITAAGGDGCEQGEAIYSNGARYMMIRNNLLSGSDFPIFTGGSAPYANGMYTRDWVIKKNAFTRNMAWLQLANVVGGNFYKDRLCVKNSLEFKDMVRVLIDGNDFASGWDSGRGQSTMLHFQSLQGDADSDCGTAPGTPGVNAGCGPLTELSDLTFTNNRVSLMGKECLNIIGQNGFSGRYATVRGSRFLFSNNLFINCGGFQGLNTAWSNALLFNGGPQDVTFIHNSFVREDNTSAGGAFIRVYCGTAESGINAGCTSPGGDITVATMTNFVFQDNIFPLHGSTVDHPGETGGAVEVAAVSGSPVSCTTAGTLDAGFFTGYTWNHNIGIGTIPASCTVKGSGSTGAALAAGTQIVTDEPSMNFRGYATHDYCLTASSPGYHAASDGVSNIGVDPVAMYAAMGLSYGPGACP